MTNRVEKAGEWAGKGFGPGFLLHSIKGRILLIFAVTLLSAGLLTLLNFWSLHTVEERLLWVSATTTCSTTSLRSGGSRRTSCSMPTPKA